ncbi:CCR4-NOT core subunit cdc39, partial [Massospora cicadina]
MASEPASPYDTDDPVTEAVLQAGVPCLESHAHLLATLEACGISPSNTGESPFNERTLASILCAMIRWASSNDFISQTQMPQLVENLVAFIKEHALALNWRMVVRSLDRPNVYFGSPEAALIPVLAYRILHTANEFIPISVFWDTWDNQVAQVSFLFQAVRSSPTVVDFTKLSSRAVINTEHLPSSDASAAERFGELCGRPWNSLDLFETVLNLAADGKQELATTLFNEGLKSDPELFFLGCVSLLPFRNELHEATLSKLYQYFLDSGARGLFPLNINWALNSASLLAGFRRCLQADNKYLGLILSTCEALHILAAIYYSSDFPLSIPIMCLAHRRDLINLKHWLEDKCSESAADLIAESVSFLRNATDQLVDLDSYADSDHPTYESAAVFFRVFSGQEAAKAYQAELQEIMSAIIIKEPKFEKLVTRELSLKLFFFKYPPDIEEEASGYFEQLYSSQWKPSDLVELLIKYRASPHPRDHVIYACATALLFEEYHHFENYPDSELETTAILFGMLINMGVFTFSLNRMAIGCILSGLDETAAKPYFNFATKALLQFRTRIAHMPEILKCFQHRPHLLKHLPELQPRGTDSAEPGASVAQREDVANSGKEGESQFQGNESFMQPPPATFENPRPSLGNPSLGGVNLDTLLSSKGKADCTAPNREAEKKLIFIVNNLSQTNLDEKSKELRAVLEPSMYRYFTHYIVVKRISAEPNQHPIYLQLLDNLNDPELSEFVLEETFYNINLLIQSEKTLTSAQERGLLKSLGSWLGCITLAKNRPILHHQMSFKHLLLDGFMTQRLIVVIPFTCKVLAQGRFGEVFKPPNPWLMAIIRLLVELSKSPGLKTNTCFEIEVLIRAFGLKPDEIHPTSLLKALPTSQGGRDAQGALAANYAEDGFNMAGSVYIDSSLSYAFIPQFREVIVTAVERAINTVAMGIVSRAVTIASFITRDIVTKDFAMEPNEDKLRRAAQQMGQVVAGAFAHATCKDHLRKAIFETLRAFFMESGLPLDHVKPEDLELIASDNLKLGVYVIQTTASERALAEIDSALFEAINNRKKSREVMTPDALTLKRNGQPFYDMAVYASGNYPTNLPDILKLKPSGLQPVQMQIYEDFAHLAIDVPDTPAGPDGFKQGSALRGDMMDLEFAHPKVVRETFDQLANELDRQISLAPDEGGQANNAELHAAYADVSVLVTRFAAREDILLIFAQKFVYRVYRSHSHLSQQVYTLLLNHLFKISPVVGMEVKKWLIYADDERKLEPGVTKALLLGGIITLEELDLQLAKQIEVGKPRVGEYGLALMRRCLLEEPVHGTLDSFSHTLAAYGKMARRNKTFDQFQAYLEDVKAVLEVRFQEHDLKANCFFYHSEWIRIYQLNSTGEKDHFDFVHKLTQHGILQDEQKLCVFIRTCIQITMEIYSKQVADNSASAQGPYHTVDALAKMIVVIIRYAQDPNDEYHNTTKVGLFTNLLTVIALMLVSDHHTLEHKFNPKPFFRLYASILYHLSAHQAHLKPVEVNLLLALNNSLSSLQPDFLPGFAFAWVALISHRLFLPRMMELPARKGWDYMRAQFANLFKFLGTILTAPISLVGWEFYQGVHRLVAVMVHDYPEFIVAYHFGLMAELPLACAQVRNMLASAIPPQLRCPPPNAAFYAGKVKPDFLQPPPMPSHFTAPLESRGLVEGVNRYLARRDFNLPLDFKASLFKDDDPEEYDAHVINCLTLYIAVADLEANPDPSLRGRTPALDLYHQLLLGLEVDGRHIFLNALFNHLRYPNLHTCYFTNVILHLFGEASTSFLREQIARVLVDRALVSLPVPWGVWCLLIELCEDSQHGFLAQDFIQAAPELLEHIERRLPRGHRPNELSFASHHASLKCPRVYPLTRSFIAAPNLASHWYASLGFVLPPTLNP